MATKAKRSPSPKNHAKILNLMADVVARAVEADHAFARLDAVHRVREFEGLNDAWQHMLEAVDAAWLAASDYCLKYDLAPRFTVAR